MPLTCKIWSCLQAPCQKFWDMFWRTRPFQRREVRRPLSPQLKPFFWYFLEEQAPLENIDKANYASAYATFGKKLLTYYKLSIVERDMKFLKKTRTTKPVYPGHGHVTNT